MKTLHLHASNPDDIAHAAGLLRDGRLVAFPTETVYGLGANALNPEAIAAIFAAKQRPDWDPLIVHLASPGHIPLIANIPASLTSRISHLASSFWPGPLTLLLPRAPAIADAVTAGRELVGVRIPAHPVAQALLQAAGLPIAAPSANLFGHTSPTTAQHVLADLDGRIDAVLDAGPTQIGLESTVLDPTQTPMLLYRPGAVSAAQITAASAAPVQLHEPPTSTATPPPQSLPSPGVGIRHYAPRARLVLVDVSEACDPLHTLLHENLIKEAGNRVGVLLPDGWPAPPGTHIFSWGAWDNPEQLAHNLFTGLRDLDQHEVEIILCPLPPPGGLYDAIRDRLRKAAMPS